MMQLCAWSDNRVFDRQCVTFAGKALTTVCCSAHQMNELKKSENHRPDNEVLKALESIRDNDDVRAQLVWLIGRDNERMFMKEAQKFKQAATRLQDEHTNKTFSAFRDCVASLKKLLVDESRIVDPFVFKKELNQQKVTIIKKARQDAKNYRQVIADRIPPEEIAEFDHVLTLAKHQTFKWGILMFGLHESITLQNKKGSELRTSLKNLWNMHKTDQDFMKYFGVDSAKEIEAMIALGESAGENKRKAGESVEATGTGGADAKKRKRSAKAAS